MPTKKRYDPATGRMRVPGPMHEVVYTNKQHNRKAKEFRTKAAADHFAEECKKKGYTNVHVY